MNKRTLLSVLVVLCLIIGVLPLVTSASPMETPTLDASGNPTAAAGDGWSFNSSTSIFTIKSGFTATEAQNDFFAALHADIVVYNIGTINGATVKNKVVSPGIISSGTFNGRVDNDGTINGGTFNDKVDNDGTISGGTFNADVLNYNQLTDGQFDGNIYNYDGAITGGTYTRYIANFPDCVISGGTFLEDSFVENKGSAIIAGGEFSGLVTNANTGMVQGGKYYGELRNNNPATITSSSGATMHKVVITSTNIAADTITTISHASQKKTIYLWSDDILVLSATKGIASVKLNGTTLTANADKSYNLQIPAGYTASEIQVEVAGVQSPITVTHSVTGENVTVNAALAEDATGTVTFTLGEASSDITLAAGAAAIQYASLVPGDYTVTVEYPGDSFYNAGSAEYAFTIAAPAPAPDPDEDTGNSETQPENGNSPATGDTTPLTLCVTVLVCSLMGLIALPLYYKKLIK